MNDQTNKPQLFEDNSSALAGMNDAAAVARATQEIQASLVIAQRFPRDEVKARAKIMQACSRKGLAEVAEYEYSRGGSKITGPTIDLLLAVANRWGNLLYGWQETDRKLGQDGVGLSSVRCFAWDTQNNSRAERTFMVKHWRDTQAGGYALEDERDIYEMISNNASRRVRSCLEQVIDQDIVDEAVDQCRKTLREGEKTPPSARAAQMVVAFAEFGVTQAMIETRLGNKLDAVSENQLASLRRVFKSLKDGVGRREDYFKPETATPGFNPPAPTPAGSQPQASKEPEDNIPMDPPAPAPVAPAVPAPAPKAAEPEPPSKIKLIRQACKASKIKEGILLGYLAETGNTDGSVGTLEELAMQFPGVVDLIIDKWSSISKTILDALKGGPR
jgi:hypothetical protein